MNFYDKLDELIAIFKQTSEYTEFMKLKEELKSEKDAYMRMKDFKDKQQEHQLKYLSGEEMSKEEETHMQNLYSIVIQNEKCRKLLEYEMKLDVMLAKMQKSMGETIKGIIEF